MNWYEISVSLTKIVENGSEANVKEEYLIQAVSVTDAETRIIEELKEAIRGSFEITKVSKKKIAEFFKSSLGGDTWYRARVCFDTDEGKKVRETHMVQADNIREAVNAHEEGMEGTVTDWTLESIAETGVIDVYKMPEEKKEEGEGPEA